MEKLYIKIVDEMGKYGYIETEDKEIYLFALNIVQIYVINFVISTIIGIAMNMLGYCLIFLISFMILRQDAGGYHARGWKACYFLSTMILVAALLWIKIQLQYKFCITVILAIVSAVSIFLYAPLADENKPLDERDRKAIKKRTRIIVSVEIATGVLLIPFQNMIACAVLSSVILCGGTYAAWFIRNKYKISNH